MRNNTISSTLLIEVVSRNKFDVVKYLVEKGANVNDTDINGNTALPYALHNTVCRDYIDKLVEFLIDSGADINHKFCDKFKPLHIAFNKRNVHLVKYMICKGAKFDMNDLKQAKFCACPDNRIIEVLSSQLISSFSHREYYKLCKMLNFYLIDDLTLIVTKCN